MFQLSDVYFRYLEPLRIAWYPATASWQVSPLAAAADAKDWPGVLPGSQEFKFLSKPTGELHVCVGFLGPYELVIPWWFENRGS